MPDLRWVWEMPTQDGFYWYRCHPKSVPEIVQVERLYRVWQFGAGDSTLAAEMNGEWYGPITPPPTG